jgi:ABC-type Fe3+ transport system substrate-binding protein
MKGQNRGASSRFETLRQEPQKRLQRPELVIHRDTKGLEHTSHHSVILDAGRPQRVLDHSPELPRGANRFFLLRLDDRRGQQVRAGFIGIGAEQLGKRRRFHAREEFGGGAALVWIHPQIERAIEFESETALGVVNLHGRQPEVREDQVCAGDFMRRQRTRKAREIAVNRREHIRTESNRAESRLRFWQFNRIGVQREQPPAGQNPAQQFRRMPAVAERRVHGDVAGSRLQHFEHLLHHNRPVSARRSFAGIADLFDGVRVPFGIQFLVFEMELARVFAAVANAALMGLRWQWFHVHRTEPRPDYHNNSRRRAPTSGACHSPVDPVRCAAVSLPCAASFRFVAAVVVTLAASVADAARAIVLTPHVDAIRHEFGQGFSRWHAEKFAKPAEIEWRVLGGTSDALRFVLSEFSRKPDGIGLDIFFGGGQEPFLVFADKELTLTYRPPAEILDGIPQQVSGMDVYDVNHTWYGAALSSFGILQNTRVQRTLGLPMVRQWEELTNPRLYNWVGAGDPRNSGTMNVMFEAFLQYYGWEKGWEVLTRIGGNVRLFDRVSSTTAKDVTLGETAYAFSIDFYGFSQVAVAGRSNMTFVLPQDFTAINPDGIAILKGAPNLTTAQRFVDFVLSETGQKLWFLPRGHPEGPKQYSVERMSVRPDLYRRYRGVSNIEFSPFDLKQSFLYDARISRERREVVAALAGALLVDTHDDLRKAWRRLIQLNFPEGTLGDLGKVPIREAEALALAKGAWKDAAVRNRKKIEWQTWAEHKYRRIASL